eukprot:SM000251S08819  [mRNA]  locus=s251:135700:138589:+ [translate_table: standard]
MGTSQRASLAQTRFFLDSSCKPRLQPAHCELPYFSARAFLGALRDGVAAFVGDSLVRNLYQSVTCLLHAEDSTGHQWYGAFDTGFLPKGCHYPTWNESQCHRFLGRNVTLCYYGSNFLAKSGKDDLHFESAGIARQSEQHYLVYLDEPDPGWFYVLPRLHLLVLGSGQWYLGSGKWVPHFRLWCMILQHAQLIESKILKLGTSPTTLDFCLLFQSPSRKKTYLLNDKVQDGLNDLMAYQQALLAMRRAVAMAPGFKGVPTFVSHSPTHYSKGEWNSGGTCTATEPGSAEEAAEVEETFKSVVEVERAVFDAEPFHFLEISHISAFRRDAHDQQWQHLPHAYNVQPYRVIRAA